MFKFNNGKNQGKYEFEAHGASYLFNMTTGKIARKNGSDLL